MIKLMEARLRKKKKFEKEEGITKTIIKKLIILNTSANFPSVKYFNRLLFPTVLSPIKIKRN